MDSFHQNELGTSHHSDNSLLVESKVFVDSHQYAHHDLPHSGSTLVDAGGETSSFVSRSPTSSCGLPSDHLGTAN